MNRRRDQPRNRLQPRRRNATTQRHTRPDPRRALLDHRPDRLRLPTRPHANCSPTTLTWTCSGIQPTTASKTTTNSRTASASQTSTPAPGSTRSRDSNVARIAANTDADEFSAPTGSRHPRSDRRGHADRDESRRRCGGSHDALAPDRVQALTTSPRHAAVPATIEEAGTDRESVRWATPWRRGRGRRGDRSGRSCWRRHRCPAGPGSCPCRGPRSRPRCSSHTGAPRTQSHPS